MEPKESLSSDEEVTSAFTPSRYKFWANYLVAFLLIPITVAALQIEPPIWILALLTIFLLLLEAELKIRSQKYFITTNRVISEKVLFSKSIKHAQYDQITDVIFKQGFMQRLLGIGNLKIYTASSEDMDIGGIKKPDTRQEKILEKKRNVEE